MLAACRAPWLERCAAAVTPWLEAWMCRAVARSVWTKAPVRSEAPATGCTEASIASRSASCGASRAKSAASLSW